MSTFSMTQWSKVESTTIWIKDQADGRFPIALQALQRVKHNVVLLTQVIDGKAVVQS
jgi:hypothetical protein